MPAAKKNLLVEDNGNRKKVFVWKDKTGRPINLTGSTARLMVRKEPTSTPLADLSSDNGQIVIIPLKGRIEITFSDADVAAIAPQGTCWYDLVITPAPDVDVRLIEGKFQISIGITRP